LKRLDYFLTLQIHCISLIERQGRERPLADSFVKHAAALDDENVALTAFDFHEHCKGMRF
jgi:hypothetical protein